MKRDSNIRDAIDESLYGVRFNQNDMRSVLRAVRRSDDAPQIAPKRAKKQRGKRLQLAFCTALAVAVIAPVSFLTLRTLGTPNVDIVTTQGGVTPAATATAQSLVTDAPSAAYIAESDAIAIARERFETLCDTSIFTFEEYTVSTAFTTYGAPAYTVTLESIYGNGCAFTVRIDALTGEVLGTSSPADAVIPKGLTRDNPNVSAWYDKYGEYRITWPLEQQAEFSRRYEGYLTRVPQTNSETASEMTPDQAISAARAALSSAANLGIADAQYAQNLTYYAVLRSERAYADGVARYEVYAFEQPLTDALPASGYLVTLRADAEYGSAPSVISIDSAAILARENAIYQ